MFEFDRFMAEVLVSEALEHIKIYPTLTLINDIHQDLETIEEFIKDNNIVINRNFDPYIVYLNVHVLIRYIEFTTRYAIKADDFREQLVSNYNLFTTLNRYEKNRGNTMLAKRTELLISQFDKYSDSEPLNSNLTTFFDNQVGTRIPTIENVLTIFKNILKRNLQDITDKEICIENLFIELFNKKTFRADLKYKYIEYKGCEISYSKPYNKAGKDTLLNFYA